MTKRTKRNTIKILTSDLEQNLRHIFTLDWSCIINTLRTAVFTYSFQVNLKRLAVMNLVVLNFHPIILPYLKPVRSRPYVRTFFF